MNRLGFFRNKVLPLVIDSSIDIHDENDIVLTKEWIKKLNSLKV